MEEFTRKLTWQEKYGYIKALKENYKLDVYYKINVKDYPVPVIINKCAVRNSKNTGNISTKYYSLTQANPDHPGHYDVGFKRADHVLCVQRDVTAKEAIYWMKQYYSSAMRLYKYEQAGKIKASDFKNDFELKYEIYYELTRISKLKMQIEDGEILL